ncbi:hypothetical protein THII_0907 [Thioploca ingrica]|uniref:Uncharacterized protein n=1 Tax=Thioploca ingrica TaxID=40754 RepID=A0A090AE58_9GAMM|nr:hypothetical protein THII_0907 [Thioploca ingrica]
MMNIIGLFSMVIIFGTLIFQIFFFGHIIGPLVFTVAAALLIWGYKVKNNRLLYAMVVFIVISNFLYFLLPRMQGEGINFIIKAANQFNSINQITLVIHLSRLTISIIIGFSLRVFSNYYSKAHVV